MSHWWEEGGEDSDRLSLQPRFSYWSVTEGAWQTGRIRLYTTCLQGWQNSVGCLDPTPFLHKNLDTQTQLYLFLVWFLSSIFYHLFHDVPLQAIRDARGRAAAVTAVFSGQCRTTVYWHTAIITEFHAFHHGTNRGNSRWARSFLHTKASSACVRINYDTGDKKGSLVNIFWWRSHRLHPRWLLCTLPMSGARWFIFPTGEGQG